jgi:hypothetical protein
MKQVFKDFSRMTEIKVGMRNRGFVIDPGFDQQLRAKPGRAFGRHSGWDFNGLVWFDGEVFHEEVWQYHKPVKTISAASLWELMQAVNSEFGSE